MSQPVAPPDVEPTVERVTPADDRVPYDLAAKALDVSRRTVERMVSDGRLERDTSATDAEKVSRVTRRSLVACLDGRRDDDATAVRRDADVSMASGLDVGRLVADLVDARADAAGLRERVRLLEAGADDTRRRDDLLASLLAGTWRQRRQARREALAGLLSEQTPPSTS